MTKVENVVCVLIKKNANVSLALSTASVHWSVKVDPRAEASVV